MEIFKVLWKGPSDKVQCEVRTKKKSLQNSKLIKRAECFLGFQGLIVGEVGK